MMMTDPYLGWTSDHVGLLSRLKAAVRILAEGRGKTRERWEKATFPLVHLRPESFPARLRSRAETVLSLRGKVAHQIGNYTHFAFDELKPRERVRFTDDLLALYEACLIDIGRTWPMWDLMYPKDIAPPKAAKI